MCYYRLTTKSSYGVHEGGESGSGTNAQGRKLLAERGSVVSLFSAEQLWNLGFRGEHVKMGVFDTGIRLDHPHVKNIRSVSLAHIFGQGVVMRRAFPRTTNRRRH